MINRSAMLTGWIGGRVALIHNAVVDDTDLPVGAGSKIEIMGHHDDCASGSIGVAFVAQQHAPP